MSLHIAIVASNLSKIYITFATVGRLHRIVGLGFWPQKVANAESRRFDGFVGYDVFLREGDI